MTSMDCPRCTSKMSEGRCPTCGYTVPTKRDDSSDILSNAKGLITALAVILFLGYLIFNTALMLFSLDLVLWETMVNETTIFILIPFGLGLAEISGYPFAIFYLFLVGSVLLSYAVIFYTGWNGFVSYIKDVFKGNFKKLDDENRATSSPILRIVTVFAALVFITMVYSIMLELTGRGIEPPPERETWEQVFGLTRAAVWEEIIVRVAYIGLPMFLYALVKGKKNFKRYLLGGFGFGERFSVTLVIISSIIFAIAHLPGWNWSVFKVIQVFPAGIFFGYLFVKDGLHSAILIHFVWDYMFGFVPDTLLEIPNFETIFSFMILFWMAVGLYYTYDYIMKFTDWLNSEDRGEKQGEKQHEDLDIENSTEPKKVVDHTAGVTIGYSCPNCGYTNAEYTEKDKLRCKRCGTESDPKSTDSQQDKNLLQKGSWPPS